MWSTSIRTGVPSRPRTIGAGLVVSRPLPAMRCGSPEPEDRRAETHRPLPPTAEVVALQLQLGARLLCHTLRADGSARGRAGSLERTLSRREILRDRGHRG